MWICGDQHSSTENLSEDTLCSYTESKLFMFTFKDFHMLSLASALIDGHVGFQKHITLVKDRSVGAEVQNTSW